jgi:hypothetical protein
MHLTSIAPRYPIGLVIFLLASSPAAAISREAYREIRGRHQGETLRLRVDLKIANLAADPNIVSLEGVRSRERSPVLFGRLESVYVRTITDEGGTRLSLTVYRNREDADRLRGSSIPQPSFINPGAAGTLSNFARQDSTSILLELKASRKDSAAQTEEIETLLDRVFYLTSNPSQEELEAFVREHRGLPIARLREITGLDSSEISRIVHESTETTPGPAASPTPQPSPGAPLAP